MANKTILSFLTLALTLLISCSDSSTGTDPEPDEPEVTTGTLDVTTTTSGNGTDEDGYTVTLDGDESKAIDLNGSVTYEDLEEDTYSVELTDLATGCTVNGENPVSANVTAGETITAAFEVNCEGSTTGAPDVEGVIVFTRVVNQDYMLFIMNADGSGERQVGDGISGTYPALSPNGTKIAYIANSAIWTVSIDGSDPQQLTSPDEFYGDDFPSWNTDGSKITYQSYAEKNSQNSDIYVMDADGGNQTQLTSHEADEEHPSWSPDGSKIIYSSDSDDDGGSEIWTVDIESKESSILVDATIENGSNLSEPVWSPDGTQIAYQGYISGGAASIFIVDADGSNAQSITSEEHSAFQPTWSPDGTYIAFTSLTNISKNTTNSIWIIETDGSQSFKLTDDQGTYSNFPSWSVAAE